MENTVDVGKKWRGAGSAEVVERAASVAFVQPFGLSSEGGGSRILRTLLEEAPVRVLSIATCPWAPPPTTTAPEIHLARRPNFGRFEKTRLSGLWNATEILFRRSFCERLRKVLLAKEISAIHATAHGFDCVSAFEVAANLGIPYLLSVHDDLAYTLHRDLHSSHAVAGLRRVWREAHSRFVISRELGELYCRRYGEADYLLVTDGVSTVPSGVRRAGANKKLRVYFMGLVHLSYLDNFRDLLGALGKVVVDHLEYEVSLTIRSGWFPALPVPSGVELRVLPFTDQTFFESDTASVDLLYLPLPFGPKDQAFARYSLSTKMVTYIGSGIPILYHGPSDSAAGRLLAENGAAHCVTVSGMAAISRTIAMELQRGVDFASNALSLARNQFLRHDILERFWRPFR
jgi:hypothetical protein